MRGVVGLIVVLGVSFGPGAPAALAQTERPAASAVFIGETCLRTGDAAFEHSLREGLDAADVDALQRVYAIATFECLGFAMEICETLDDRAACLADLALWVAQTRAGIAEGLPDSLDGAERYTGALARARAEADRANCDEMTEDQRARYCDVVAEGVALEDAYDASRLARRAGAVEVVGHGPVDLELIR